MTIYVIDVHMRTHTCPADPEEHPIDIARTIVQIIPGRPCQHPVTLHSGHATVTIPCGRHVPADRQCDGCRTIITTRTLTAEYLGYHGPDDGSAPAQRIPSGDGPNPCDVCGQPLAAQLAEWGRHLLCGPRPGRTNASTKTTAMGRTKSRNTTTKAAA